MVRLRRLVTICALPCAVWWIERVETLLRRYLSVVCNCFCSVTVTTHRFSATSTQRGSPPAPLHYSTKQRRANLTSVCAQRRGWYWVGLRCINNRNVTNQTRNQSAIMARNHRGGRLSRPRVCDIITHSIVYNRIGIGFWCEPQAFLRSTRRQLSAEAVGFSNSDPRR